MTRKLALLGAVAGLAMTPSGNAQQITKPLSSLAASSQVGKVVCHGFAAVPMTQDQEQTLPLQIIAKLGCGDNVSVLSDPESYTINVRTADGKTGYVARVYLTVREGEVPSSVTPALASAQVQNGVARWQPGGLGSEQFSADDSAVESLTVNGVTVQVSLHDTGWKLRANILVANADAERIYINPARFTLEEHVPFVKTLAYQDPHRLVNAATHQILWTSASAYAPGGQWSQSSSTNNAAALVATSYRVPVPAGASRAPVSIAKDGDAKESVLREGKIMQGEKSEGAVWFERDKKAEQLVLRVPVNGIVYEFPLSFNHDK
jgi:hypothetical protein